MFPRLSTDNKKLFLQKVSSCRPVSFRIINRDKALRRSDSLFKFSVLRAINRYVDVDLSNGILSRRTVRIIADAFYKHYFQNNSARFLFDIRHSASFQMQDVVPLLHVSKSYLLTHDKQCFDT